MSTAAPDGEAGGGEGGGGGAEGRSRARKQLPLRLDPAVHEAIARWAADDLRSVNAQVEWVLRRALEEAGRMPRGAGGLPRRGRPPST
ncbi:hypothetical protein [Kineococcus glutinatus]|uniref:Toxin-antitoxin system HicB family antitoxin n=1 Tax=Kineococcus glutinatus TaxID=1070872 RepID=A0ABP9HNP6_9ACTN